MRATGPITFAPRTLPVHFGIVWKLRQTHTTSNSTTHAVVPDPEAKHRDDPWFTMCTGESADERRMGWADDLTCHKCKRKLAELEEARI